MPAANLQTICSSGALLQPCVALFTCPQPFVHARSKSQSWVCVCVCVPVLASVHGLGVCVCVCQSWVCAPVLAILPGLGVCVCVPVLAVLPGLGVCARWFFQDWVCVCVCASPGFHPLGVCASQTICSSGTLLQPYIALFACPQPFVHARRPFAALAPFSCSQLSIPFSWLRSHLTRRVSTTISAA